MTVAEFLEWEPDDRSGALWQLLDGEPEMMAPASDRHGSIQSRLGQLIGVHLDTNSTAVVAEVLRRASDGAWPQQPEIIGADGELRFDSIGFAVSLREIYRTSGLM